MLGRGKVDSMLGRGEGSEWVVCRMRVGVYAESRDSGMCRMRVECMRNVTQEKGGLFVLSVRVSEWPVG